MKVIEIIVDLFYDDSASFWLTLVILAVTFGLTRLLPSAPIVAVIVLVLGIGFMLVNYQQRMLKAHLDKKS